jgi:broad-specificity NMP kinase
MKRVLITGLSGTGKSTAIERLRQLGYKTVDTDYDGFAELVPWPPGQAASESREWVWDEDRMRKLLTTEDSEALFICGTARNQGTFYPLFDHVVLFSAPGEVMAKRMATRTNNPYGKRPEEVALHLSLKETLEPHFRRAATIEIDTSAPLDEVIADLLRAVGLPRTELGR